MIENVTPIIETAKGISDYGITTVICACFVIISVAGQWAIFNWFKTIINDMLKTTACKMDDLLAETKTQNEQLADIAEGLRTKTLLEIKDISKTCFDLSAERVYRIIRKVKRENNIADKSATKTKVRMLLTNLHEDRNSRFDNHTYHGRALSEYTKDEWIDWVADVVLGEVYAEKENTDRMVTNVTAVYDRIKLDFYHRLTN